MKKNDSENAQFWQKIIQAIPTPFYVIDVSNYRIVAANSAHMASRQAVGRTCHEISHRSDTPCSGDNHICPLKIVLTSQKDVIVEHVHASGSDSKRYIEIHGYPVFAEDGELTHMIEFSQDITARKVAELALEEKNNELEVACENLRSARAQLLQSEKLAVIGQLAAGVAHEINNPAGFVSSNLATLEKYGEKINAFIDSLEGSIETGRKEEIADHKKRLKIDYILSDFPDLIGQCRSGLDRIANTVRGLKSFCRADNNRVELADINACLDEAITLVWNELKYKATMQKEYGAVPKMYCMPQQLEQVFMNLLVNAAHAIDKNGEITVKTWCDGSSSFVAISDSGCGIPSERMEQIFEPFFTTKVTGKGTGLGLSICREIVYKHQGEISVVSRQGHGATFTIALPLLDEKFFLQHSTKGSGMEE
ncbi:MAG: ATP-binding protein [Pseudomonadota bacterium]